MTTNALIVIPARYASSRFPGKPLVPLVGLSMIERVYRIAQAAQNSESCIVATDDERIAQHVRQFRGRVVMTSPDCRNGSERVLDALHKLETVPEIVVNLQGDAPLIPPWIVRALIDALSQDPKLEVATPGIALNQNEYQELKAAKLRGSTTGTLVVFDHNYRALYFSKNMIPAHRAAPTIEHPAYRHVGLYAYRPRALETFLGLAEGPLERAESIEALRFLEHGIPVRIVIVDYRGRRHCSVDTPEDVAKAEQIIREEGELCT